MNEYAGKKAVVTGVPESEAGLASGLVNTSQQMGGALGLAALAAVAAYATGGPGSHVAASSGCPRTPIHDNHYYARHTSQ